ncbi:MAG: hypothetical protein KJO67_10260, partial [Silicimonas sp.]|nr:hypothetical protein [Silicimonas sp.]
AQFDARATLLIDERQADLDQEISSLQPLVRNDTGFQNQLQILRSGHVAADVVRRLGLHDNDDFVSPPRSALGQVKSDLTGRLKSLLPRPAIAPAAQATASDGDDEARIMRTAVLLAERTNFNRIGKSYSVEIGYRSHDPALATGIANAYAEAYLADGLRTNLAASDRTAAWMEARIDEIRQAAFDASREAERFRARFGATDQQGLREREQRVDALNDLFQALEERYQEQLLAGSFPVANGRVLTAALIPEDPSRPNALLLLVAGLAFGALVGLGIAVLRELREVGLRTAGDVGTLGVAFMGYLPAIGRRDRLPASRRGDTAPLVLDSADQVVAPPRRSPPVVSRLTLGLPAGGAEFSDSTIVAGGDTAYGKAVRSILWSLSLEPAGDGARVLGVGGLTRGEGATTLAANLAQQAVENGGRTLLIEADLGRPGASTVLRRNHRGKDDGAREVPSPGITQRLASGLSVLPAQGADASVSIRVREIRSAVQNASPDYDLIVVDMPPLTHPDAVSLVSSLDGILLVAGWGRTPRRSIEAFLARNAAFRKRLIGAVLNRTRMRKLSLYGAPPEEIAAFGEG